MQLYVLGFMFNEQLSQVLMIRKNKPEWQKGLLNGIGGKVEEKDPTWISAMIREFKEETDLDTDASEWKEFGTSQSSNHMIKCYCGISNKIYDAKTTTEEVVCVVDIDEIQRAIGGTAGGFCLRSTPSWINLALLSLKDKDFSAVNLHYK